MADPTDWQAVARARSLDIPEDAVAKIAPSLDALLAAFESLRDRVPHSMEPANTLSEAAVIGE